MYTKGFEVIFSVNGSLIDDKNDHEDLKMKIILKTSLFCVKFEEFQKNGFLSVKKNSKLNISRLKRVMTLKFCTGLQLIMRM